MKFEQILQTFSLPTCNHLSVNIFPSPSLLKATLNRTSVITRRECCRDIPSSIYENNEKKERKRRRKKKIASIQLRYDCAQKQRTSVKKNEARVFSHGAREVTRTGRRRTGLLSRAESPSSSSRSRFSSKLEKKCWLRAGVGTNRQGRNSGRG